jgi:hypothetical protein
VTPLAVLVIVALGAASPGAGAAPGTPIVFDSTPASDSNQTSATFSFHDSAGGTPTFACKLDSGSFAACVSPTSFSGLAEGSHTVTVEITSATGEVPPASYTWTVDLTPPVTQVTSQPPAVTNSTTATFVFTSPDATATFRCSLNGAPAQACASPLTYSGLSDAARSLLIQAVDPAGNVDPNAPTIHWTVDTTPPDTVLADPGTLTAKDVAIFQFTSTEANSTFQCAFRNAAFSACTSPIAEDVPGSGPQVFKVRAVDAAGNVDPTPAVHTWTSDLTPPKRPAVTIFAAPTASASRVAPVPTPQRNPGLTLVFTNPLAKLLTTPAFTLSLHLHAQWSSDATAKKFDVTVDEYPQDSTGLNEQGESTVYERVYQHTTRRALNLTLAPGTTVCVKVDATDSLGNTSRSRTACTTVPVSFTPRDPGPPPVKDAKAWRGYYIHLGAKGYYYVENISDEFSATPTHAALVAERCAHCGVVEFDFITFVGNPHAKLHKLATVDLNSSDKSGEFRLISVALPVTRLRRDGEGQIVIRAVSGKPPIAGIGLAD